MSVVIPARNDAADLANAVATVEAQRGVELREIVIAVGPSSDDTKGEALRLSARNSAIAVLDNPSGSTPAALNAAIGNTTGDIVVRVDARSQLPTDYITNALETMRETNAANVGALQVPVGSTSPERAIAAAMRCRFGSGGAAYRHSTTRQEVETAYLGVFRRTALEQVGGFDERFIRNQDSELNIRLRKAGFQVWLDPRLKVDYRPRPGLVALAKQYWQYGWWRAITLRRHPSSMQLRHAIVPVAIAGIGGATALGVFWHASFLAVPAAYVAVLVAVSASDRSDLTPRERAIMAAALATIHVSWGTAILISAIARSNVDDADRSVRPSK